MELMRYLSMHDLQLAIQLEHTKTLGGLANEREDDLIHCMRKMIMEAINGRCWKTVCLPATPTKLLLVGHLPYV